MRIKFTICWIMSILFFQNTMANVYTVTTNADNGAGSIRQAITDANTHAGPDAIAFNIQSVNIIDRTISLLSVLPSLMGSVTIDGSTQSTGSPFGVSFAKIQITSAANLDVCFSIHADSCEIYSLFITNFKTGINIENSYAKIGAIQRGNVIYNCSVSCVKIQFTNHVALQGNLIGMDTAQAVLPIPTGNGIDVINSYAVSIGGKTFLAYNVISGNYYGIHLDNASYVDLNSNFIGTDLDTLIAKPNQYGIRGTGLNTNIEIGGDSAFEKNTISGNAYAGIYGNFVSSVIQGNYIGTDAGINPMGNGTNGIYLTIGSSSNLIGGDDNSKQNTIAYNGQEAIFLQNATCTDNTIARNSIYCNSQLFGSGGIQTNGGNGGINPPLLLIVNSTGIAGLTIPSGIVEIFADDDCNLCEGKSYIASVIANTNGTFTYVAPITGKITATATYPAGTSEFSPCTDSTAETCLISGFSAPSPACYGVPVSFTDESVTAPSSTLTSWHWDFGDGNSSSVQFPDNSYFNAGTYTIQLITTNSNGCIDTSTQDITINEPPSAQFFVPAMVCVNTPLNYTDQSSGGNGGAVSEWNWNFGDGSNSVFVQNPAYTYSATGAYTTTLIVTNNFGCSDTTSSLVSVVGAPTASFTSTGVFQQVTFTNTSTTNGAYSSSWDFGDGSSSTENNPQHTYGSAGTYTVCLTVLDSFCMISDSFCAVFDVATGVPDAITASQMITVSPNPANRYITISGGGLQIHSVHLLNLPGDDLMELKNSGGKNGLIKLNLPDLSSGIYLLKIETDRGSVTRKITISKE